MPRRHLKTETSFCLIPCAQALEAPWTSRMPQRIKTPGLSKLQRLEKTGLYARVQDALIGGRTVQHAAMADRGNAHATRGPWGGSGICPHGRENSQCKECGGLWICPQRREKSQCKQCGGSGSSEGTAAVMVNCGQLNLAAYSSDACTGETLADLSSAKRANGCNDEDAEGAHTFSEMPSALLAEDLTLAIKSNVRKQVRPTTRVHTTPATGSSGCRQLAICRLRNL